VVDTEVLTVRGSLAAYATGSRAGGSVWELLFKNVRLFFLGSDHFPAEVRPPRPAS